MSRAPYSETFSSEEGFTLIEALVALAVVAIFVSSLGLLASSNARGVAALRRHAAMASAARLLAADLVDSSKLEQGAMSGILDGRTWRATLAPFHGDGLSRRSSKMWTPEIATIAISDAEGGQYSYQTILLRRVAP